MGNFMTKIVLDFFVAFGVVLGASMLAGIGAVLTLQPPSFYMLRISETIKLWAVVVAIGGAIDPFRVIESNFLDGNLNPAIKEILYMAAAFIGAHIGTKLIGWICGGGIEN